MQTGLIMLMGLLAKTAILLTEYASEKRRQGMSITEAALDAARVRFRPILMTALTMIFGLLPMVFATGVGANGNRSLAIGTVGGMLVGTLALLFVVPLLFMDFPAHPGEMDAEKDFTGHGGYQQTIKMKYEKSNRIHRMRHVAVQLRHL